MRRARRRDRGLADLQRYFADEMERRLKREGYLIPPPK
jgi:hypothetical protein